MAGGPQEAFGKLRPDDLLQAAALEPHRLVARALRVTETVERDIALPAEVESRVGAVLEDRDDLSPGGPDVLVGLAQLGEVLAAEWSPEVAHESHDQRLRAPALRELHLAVARFELHVGERVPRFEPAHRA
jgi:hypothetical protein